jgi:1-acyl-sn-glycerol-3-phosphate acyltransferase
VDAALCRLARFALSVFFRKIEIEGAERVPLDRPLVVVANHTNGLIDPALLLVALPVVPRFLGKSTLWDIKPLAPLLDLAGVIPVFRRQDPGVDVAQNVDTFARCHRALAAGGTIALFPEGTSHSEPGLLPLKTGAARIVLEAEQRYGPLGVRVVPVGLVFDAKARFRSRVLVVVGEPIDPLAVAVEAEDEAGGADDPAEDRAAVRALTAAIEDGLREVTLNFASWREAVLIARAAEIWARPELDVPRIEPLGSGFSSRRAFSAGYRRLSERHPDKVHEAAGAVEDYDRLRRAARVRDEQVAAAYQTPPVVRYLLATLATLTLRLPVAAVGTVLNWVPYRLVGLVARRVRDLPDQQATFKVFPALAVYPLVWLAEAALAAWAAARWAAGTSAVGWAPWIGVAAGLAVLLAAPATGRYALGFHDRRTRLLAEVRGFLVLRTRRRLAGELRRRRAEVRRRVAERVELDARDEQARSGGGQRPGAPGGAPPGSPA